MSRFSALGVLLLLLPEIIDGQNHALTFEKEIGVGWQIDKPGWMSFVSFSPDGTMVASDGSFAHNDGSGDLALWSFPEGRLIRRLAVQPTAISSDWKYYATDQVSGKSKPKSHCSPWATKCPPSTPSARTAATLPSHQTAKRASIRTFVLWS
jgi:hypothetical protein